MSDAATKMRYREFVRRTGRSDSVESVREFLHIEMLRILGIQNPCNLILHGGCKMRCVDGSPRYSMDMDFSLMDFAGRSREEMASMVYRAVNPLLRKLARVGIVLESPRERWHSDDTGVKLCFKANALKDLSPKSFAGHPGDMNFNIDFDPLLPEEQVQIASPIADRSLQILVLDDSTHMARKAAAVLLRSQLRDLYDLDLYIARGTGYSLPVARRRLQSPDLTHEDLIERLCERVGELDLQARAHQLHLPSEVERNAFLIPGDRIAAIGNMRMSQ